MVVGAAVRAASSGALTSSSGPVSMAGISTCLDRGRRRGSRGELARRGCCQRSRERTQARRQHRARSHASPALRRRAHPAVSPVALPDRERVPLRRGEGADLDRRGTRDARGRVARRAHQGANGAPLLITRAMAAELERLRELRQRTAGGHAADPGAIGSEAHGARVRAPGG